MVYIVFVSNHVYEEDFISTYKFFHDLDEAKKYKQSIDEEGDYFTVCEIYEANRIA
jgi:hypothetical protein